MSVDQDSHWGINSPNITSWKLKRWTCIQLKVGIIRKKIKVNRDANWTHRACIFNRLCAEYAVFYQTKDRISIAYKWSLKPKTVQLFLKIRNVSMSFLCSLRRSWFSNTKSTYFLRNKRSSIRLCQAMREWSFQSMPSIEVIILIYIDFSGFEMAHALIGSDKWLSLLVFINNNVRNISLRPYICFCR